MGQPRPSPNNGPTFKREPTMPDLQPSSNAPAGMPPGTALAAAAWLDDDIALGCECADPALQIERWSPEFLAAVGEQ